MSDARPPLRSPAYAELLAARREALRARHQRLAELFRQDLALWFACVGGVALVLTAGVKLASSPILPASVRTWALVLLLVLLALSVFVFAASAPAMRAWFRAESVRRGLLAQRLEHGSHAAALTRLTDPPPGRWPVLVLRPPDPEAALRPEVIEPTHPGFLPRSGALSTGPGSRHDPFSQARLPGLTASVPRPAELPKPAPVVPGVLEGLELFVGGGEELAHVLPEAALPLGLAVLDDAHRWREGSPAWPRLDTVLDWELEVIRELAAEVRGVVVELGSERATLDRTLLDSLGPRLLLVVPPGWLRSWPVGLHRPAEAVITERGRVLQRAVARWWAALPPRGASGP